MNHAKLLCDISELNHLFSDSVSVENFLQQTVQMVAKHMKVDVCSIYLLNENNNTLTLRATKGLSKKSIGTVELKVGEGITGLAVKELRPINISGASKNPSSKLFKDIGEEKYENLLAVPITRGVQQIGALVLQRKSSNPFLEKDILACKAVASQLANMIENARFLISLHSTQEQKKNPALKESLKFIKAKTASEGIVFSESYLFSNKKNFASLQNKLFTTRYSLKEFTRAIEKTKSQLECMQKEVEEKLNDAASLIFASHLLILKDHEYIGQMENLINQGVNPPDAVLCVTKKYIDIFSVGKNKFVREKVQDIEDLCVRVVSNIIGDSDEIVNYSNKVIIAENLFPSELLKMTSEKVAGIILVSGGVTSHLSILARSLQVPMVIANIPDLLDVEDRTKILLDADQGNIYLEPDDQVVSEFKRRRRDKETIEKNYAEVKEHTFTADGIQIKLMANINLLSDLKLAHKVKCEGVGLYRTEFPFIVRNNFPSEEEQYITYKKLADSMKSKPIIFRTLDIGGDKMLSYYHDVQEQNPAIGMRSIRFSLTNKDVFTQQIRAILRAGYEADLKIMFPMISSLDEFDQARNLVYECADSLKKDGMEFNPSPAIGMMIELPSVVELIDEFAKEVDFFSIGTNDFIQFMLGVDRTNEKVASFYMPYHPSVLRSMKRIVDSANRHGKMISVCGSMSNDLRYIKFMLGIGLRSLSMNPSFLPRVQKTIESFTIKEAQQYVEKLLSFSRAQSIAEFMELTL